MTELMAAQGLTATDDANAADLVVLNTCHIREKATEKVYSDIGRLRKHGNDPMIAVAGCVAQAEGVEIAHRAKVDIVVGPQAYHNLPDLVAKASRGELGLDTDMTRISTRWVGSRRCSPAACRSRANAWRRRRAGHSKCSKRIRAGSNDCASTPPSRSPKAPSPNAHRHETARFVRSGRKKAGDQPPAFHSHLLQTA